MNTKQKGAYGDGGAAGNAEFPSARYFQIHFEYLESLLEEAKRSLDALKEQVAEAHRVANGRHETEGSVRHTPQIVTAQALTLRGDARTGKRDSKRSPEQANRDLVSEG